MSLPHSPLRFRAKSLSPRWSQCPPRRAIMRRVFCAFLFLAAFSPLAVAQTLEKAKLRQAIGMPAVSASLGVLFRAHERDGRGNKLDPVQGRVELEKKLAGARDDGCIYLEQYALYLECLKDDKKAKVLATKAEAVLRPHMQTNDPKQGYLLTIYATVLEAMVENPW